MEWCDGNGNGVNDGDGVNDGFCVFCDFVVDSKLSVGSLSAWDTYVHPA